MEIRPHGDVLGLGVPAPSAEEWSADARGAIVVGADGEVLGLEHQWSSSADAAND